MVFRTDNATSVASAPSIPAVGTPGFFTSGNPGGGVPATVLDAWWLNMIQEEFYAVPVAAGLTPSKTNNGQLLEAINILIANAVTASSPSGKFISPHLAPYYNNASSIILPAGLSVEDSTGASTITLDANKTLTLASSGSINQLDTGSEANSTNYYVYLMGDSNGINSPGAVFSTNPTTPGVISGYDRYRRLNMWVHNDASGNIIPFTLTNWPFATTVTYDVRTTWSNSGVLTAGDTNILSGGTATSMTDVSAATFLPAICRNGLFNVVTDHQGTGSAYYYLRPKGANSNGIGVVGWGAVFTPNLFIPTNASQIIQYQKYFDTGGGSDKIFIDVQGGMVTEIA